MRLKTILVVGIGASMLGASAAPGAALLGNDFSGRLYDISTATGVASNQRNTGIGALSGLEFDNGGALFGLGAADDSLYQIDVATGDATLIGDTGINVTEGGLAYDPVTGTMYGTQALVDDLLYTIDTSNGLATQVGVVPSDDLSAIAFDGSGSLWGLDTSTGSLLEIDTSDASIISTTPLSLSALDTVGGLEYDPVTGTMYASVTPIGGASSLYTLDLNTGVLSVVGSHGVSQMAGLAYIPAPGAIAMVGGVGLAGLRRRR